MRRVQAWLAAAMLVAPAVPAAAAEQEARPLDYEPEAVVQGRASVVSAPLLFEITAEMDGARLELAGDYTGSALGVLLLGPADPARAAASGCSVRPRPEGRPLAECDVRIVRFAQFGHVDAVRRLDWAVLLDPPQASSSRISGGLTEQGGLSFPGSILLRPHLVLLLRPAGSATTLRLRSRQSLDLEGTLDGWPPYTADWPPRSLVLALKNGPVAYYEESKIDLPDARPSLVVTDLRVSLGTQPTEFFQQTPRWAATSVLTPKGTSWSGEGAVGGAELTWTAVEQPLIGISWFNLYRNATPGDPRGWRRFAQVPATQRKVVDPDFDGRTRTEYLVSHVTELPLGLSCEGAYSAPVALEAVRAAAPGNAATASRER